MALFTSHIQFNLEEWRGTNGRIKGLVGQSEKVTHTVEQRENLVMLILK